MSRKHINGEILGRGCFAVINDRLIAKCGGEEVGSAMSKRDAKRDAKREAGRLRRRSSKTLARNLLNDL